MNLKQKVRYHFRMGVFFRDKFICHGCGFKSNEQKCDQDLDAHHITDRNEMSNGGYVKENGITLCKDICHGLAEEFHITGGEEWVKGFHPDDLYEKINSSKELAIEKSS